MSRLIAFDFDGTLVDSFPIYQEVMTEYCTRNGLPLIDFDTLFKTYGDNDAPCYGWAGMPLPEQRTRIRDVFLRAEAAHADPYNKIATPFPRVANTLETLKSQGYTLAIITSKLREPTEYTLRHHGLDRHFDMMMTRSETDYFKELGGTNAPADRPRMKPAPDKLLHVARALGHNPAQAIMVGDTTWDILMGKAAGAHAFGVSWGAHDEKMLTDAGADAVLAGTLDELIPHVDEH